MHRVRRVRLLRLESSARRGRRKKRCGYADRRPTFGIDRCPETRLPVRSLRVRLRCPSGDSTTWVVERLTTTGSSLSTRSAKLSGAAWARDDPAQIRVASSNGSATVHLLMCWSKPNVWLTYVPLRILSLVKLRASVEIHDRREIIPQAAAGGPSRRHSITGHDRGRSFLRNVRLVAVGGRLPRSPP